MKNEDTSPPAAARAIRRPSVRRTLWVAFASLLLLVTLALSVVSYIGTRRLAGSQAEALMDGVRRETGVQLHRIFDPIRQKVLEDYASIRTGRYTTKAPTALKDRLYPNLFSLPQVDSLMLGDLTGSQFLVMRYTPAVHRSAVLAPVAATLPPPPSGRALQFFTRDFRPAEWGETSRWTLWDEVGRTAVHSWELPLSGYDGRARPWHRAAMAKFADLPLDEAHQASYDLIAWTDVYHLFTTGKPGISASVAARDPAGRVLIVAYDLLLDEIALFSSSSSPTPHGQLLILTDDDRLLGPPRDERPDAVQRRANSIIHPATQADYPVAAEAVSIWQKQHRRATGRYRVTLGGETWWAGFAPFEIGPGRLLWMVVLLPEADLVPAAAQHQRLILAIGALALLLAGLATNRMARRFAAPIAALAEQARRIAALDLAPLPPVRSPVAELNELSTTLAETRESLRQHVAERQKARDALAASEQQLRTLAENSPDVIIRFDSAGRHLFVNPAYKRVTGFAAAQVERRTLAEIPYPPELVARWQKALAEAGSTREPAPVEFNYTTPAGERHFEARLVREPATDGGVTILAVIHDISDRVRAAEALRRSEAHHRTLIESALVGIVVHQDGLVRYANPAVLQIFGYAAAAEVVDRLRWDTCVDPAVCGELAARCAAVLRGEPQTPHPGWELIRKDGTRRWVQSSACAIEWDGRPALLSFLRDITDLREATERQAALEEQLRHAQKLEAVGLLAGGIAHDFNNLLQVIGGNAQLAELSDLDSASRQAALGEILKTVQRAAQLTRQLLAFSRRQALAREETDLNVFVADHVRMIRRLISETIRIELHADPLPLVVLVDRGQLEQVLLNLCINARDAMPKGGLLRIRLGAITLDADAAGRLGREPGTRYARLAVSDTGHGMDKATLARIFDPFFSTKPREKGTGLGLSVVYGIVRQHEGFIEVASRPGEGAEFEVLLPHLADREAPVARPPEAPPVPLKATGTILLAEDNDAIRQLAEATLRHAGYTVHSASDGLEAVEFIREQRAAVDLLFFDVMMPRMGGFEATRECRKLRPDLPVIFASGYAADSVDEGESIPDGAHVLQKPYRSEALLRLVSSLLTPQRN